MQRFGSLLIIVLLNLPCFGQSGDTNVARITPWYQNKAGAVSVTFDDACFTQYSYAYPILEKYNIKATFGIVGEWVRENPDSTAEEGGIKMKRMGWIQLRELSGHGHELSAHGYVHRRYDKRKPVAELAASMKTIKDTIEKHCGTPVYTLHYPYSFASGNIPLAAKEAGYLFGRTGLDSINSSSPQDMFLLASQAILNENQPDTLTFTQWIAGANDHWLILMYHHLFPADSREIRLFRNDNVIDTYSLTPSHFDRQMRELAGSGLWLATVGNIGKYATERDNTKLKIRKRKGSILIQTTTGLDTSVYNQALTLALEIPWKKIKIHGSLNDGLAVKDGNSFFIDFKPGAEIRIKRSH